jgi:excisionase family DNA binding protein
VLGRSRWLGLRSRQGSELSEGEQALDEVETLVAAPTPEATLLTVEEVARVLRVSRTRVFDLLGAGEFDGLMIGRRRLVPRKSVEAFLSRLGAL